MLARLSPIPARARGVCLLMPPPTACSNGPVSLAAARIAAPTLTLAMAPSAIAPFAPRSNHVHGASSASSRLVHLRNTLSQPMPHHLSMQTVSRHAQRLFTARRQLAGFNHECKPVQTDLRFLRARHDSTVTDQLRASLLHAQSDLCEQSSALLNRVVPAGVSPRGGVNRPLLIEELPLEHQAQIMLACTPSHLLNDSQMMAWNLPGVYELIEIAEGRGTEPPGQPWPWREIHPRLLRAQSDDMLVGKTRYRDSVMGLNPDYGRSLESDEAAFTFGTRLDRAREWLLQCITGELPPTSPNKTPRLSEKNLNRHNQKMANQPVFVDRLAVFLRDI